MKREKIKLPESMDQTDWGPWTINNEIYTKVDEVHHHGDGQETDVIVQRLSDSKFFKFTYTYFPDSVRDPFEFDTSMTEVFPETKTVYK